MADELKAALEDIVTTLDWLQVPLRFSEAEADPQTVRQWWIKREQLAEGNSYPYPWPEGVWRNEPDKVQWVDKATGLPCLIVRSRLGNLCGYAGVYETHPLYKLDYSGIEDHLDAHGGITFSGPCQEHAEEGRGICHIPEPGTSDKVWWFGFDCAHCDDLAPGMAGLYNRMPNLAPYHSSDIYRDVSYVKAEVQQLALQLARGV